MFFDGIYGSIYGSSAIYQKVFAQCLRYLSCLIGCDVFGQRYAFNVITYGTLGADIFFLLCCFYTVFAYQNEAIKCVCYTSFGILVSDERRCGMWCRFVCARLRFSGEGQTDRNRLENVVSTRRNPHTHHTHTHKRNHQSMPITFQYQFHAHDNTQVLVKCCTLIKRRPIILENIEVIRGIYASADVPTASNFNVVDMCSQYSLKITRAIFTLYLVCASILYPLPWVNYLLTGQMELMSPVLIPGVDQKQLLGYAILYVFHCHSVFFGSVCFATCDILFTNSALHVMLFAGMIETKFDAINRMLTTGQCNAAKAKCEIMEVIMLHLDFMR